MDHIIVTITFYYHIITYYHYIILYTISYHIITYHYIITLLLLSSLLLEDDNILSQGTEVILKRNTNFKQL